jgi:hypothetical protein
VEGPVISQKDHLLQLATVSLDLEARRRQVPQILIKILPANLRNFLITQAIDNLNCNLFKLIFEI